MTHTQRSAYPRKNLRPRPTPVPSIPRVTSRPRGHSRKTDIVSNGTAPAYCRAIATRSLTVLAGRRRMRPDGRAPSPTRATATATRSGTFKTASANYHTPSHSNRRCHQLVDQSAKLSMRPERSQLVLRCARLPDSNCEDTCGRVRGPDTYTQTLASCRYAWTNISSY